MAGFTDVLGVFTDAKEAFEDFGDKEFLNKVQGVLNYATAVVSFSDLLIKKTPIGLDIVAFKANILKTSLAVTNLARAIHENKSGNAATAEIAVQLVNLVGGIAGVVGSIPGDEFNPEVKIAANVVSLEASAVSQYLDTPSGAENFNNFWRSLNSLVFVSTSNTGTANTIPVDFGIVDDGWNDIPLSQVFADKNSGSNINEAESFTKSWIDPAINELRVDVSSIETTVDPNIGVVRIDYGDRAAINGSGEVVVNDNAEQVCTESYSDQATNNIELVQDFSLTINAQEDFLNSDNTNIADYNDDGYNASGYDSSGYDADGYDADGYDADGYDADGYDADGYDADGYDADGYDADGYDADGYDADGYDADGYDADGYDADGYDADGYDADGYDADGYDADGYDADGYDADGYDADGYDADGYDADGYDADGYDADGYDADGYDADGYDADGYDADGYDSSGYDSSGYDDTGDISSNEN